MIIMGSKGKAEDMKTIFFGSTTEKVLRFITRPVLCVPPEVDYRKGLSTSLAFSFLNYSGLHLIQMGMVVEH